MLFWGKRGLGEHQGEQEGGSDCGQFQKNGAKMKVMIQVSVYPLGTEKIGERVMEAIQAISGMGLETFTNPMSTTISCELEDGLEALEKMYRAIGQDGKAIMNVTVSNACG